MYESMGNSKIKMLWECRESDYSYVNKNKLVKTKTTNFQAFILQLPYSSMLGFFYG